MTTLVLLALGLPVALSSLVLVGARRPWLGGGRARGGRDASGLAAAASSRGNWAWGLAVALAMVASMLAQERRFDWPPAARWHAVAYLGLAQALVAGLAQRMSRGVIIHVAAAAAMGALAGAVLRLPGLETTVARCLVGGAMTASGIALTFASRAQRPDGVAIAVILVLVALCAMFMQRHFAKGALVCAAVSAALGVGLVLSWARWTGGFGVSGVLMVGALVPMLAATGYAYDDAGPWRWTWALAAAAPLVMLVPAAFGTKGRRSASPVSARSWRVSLASVVCVALVAVGAVVAQHELARSTGSHGSDAYYSP